MRMHEPMSRLWLAIVVMTMAFGVGIYLFDVLPHTKKTLQPADIVQTLAEAQFHAWATLLGAPPIHMGGPSKVLLHKNKLF